MSDEHTMHASTVGNGRGQSVYPENRVAILVDCDNTIPAMLDHALRMVAQFGRVVIRRGYGNYETLGHRWQEALVQQGFTPHLQYQYASGKNTADIALALDALEAMFDQRADMFCLVTSDSDFAYLCRKLRERGATVCVVGAAKTPAALRNASDHFFEWTGERRPQLELAQEHKRPVRAGGDMPSKDANRAREILPDFMADAIRLLTDASPEEKVALGSLGLYLRRTDPGFSPAAYGYSGLLNMLKACEGLQLIKENGGHYTVRLDPSHSHSATRATPPA